VEAVFSGLVSLCIHVVTKMFTDDRGIEMSKEGSGDWNKGYTWTSVMWLGKWYSMKMKAVRSSKTMAAIYETAPWRNLQSCSDIHVFEVSYGMDGPCYL